ncbi:MAG TPA: acyl-CoA dehydratase activase [bacterium]|nr:acyl-CoA dehydratase activase [bacterium]
MIAIGCDVGSLFAKAVVMDGDKLLASRIARTTGNVASELEDLLSAVVSDAGASRNKVERLVATGAGADLVPGADLCEDGVACVAAAAAYYLPDVQLAIDIGGQSITALLLDPDGDVVNFMRNDKCASGSGRFLEMMSEKLNLDVSEVDRETAAAKGPVELTAQCGVFAESEVITHVNAGASRPDVMAGVCAAVAKIVVAQGRRFGSAGHYTLTGGVARTQAVTRIIRQKLPGTFHQFPFDPQLAAAIGAALLADTD